MVNLSSLISVLPRYTIIPFTLSDETTPLITGFNKVVWKIPIAFTLTALPQISLSTAQTSGTLVTVDINVNGSTILSTKLTIDNTEKSSATAATAAVLTSFALAAQDEISWDVDNLGDGTAKGLKGNLIGIPA